MSGFKLGRTAPLFTAAHMRAAHRVTASLSALGPPPPASADFVSAVTDLVGADWKMLGNDSVGDCVCADAGHALMLRSANVGQWRMPSTDEVLALYSAITGYDPTQTDAAGNNPTDQGTDESVACAYMISTGFLGHKSVGTAPVAAGIVDDAALNRMKWTVQLFGTARLGVNLPDNAEAQFDANVPWAVSGTPSIVGGHDVCVVKYDPQFAYVITWGKMQPVTYDWLKKYCEEIHCEVYPDFLMSSGLTPAGFDQTALITDLAALRT